VLDLRPRQPKVVQSQVTIGTPLLPEAGFPFGVLGRKQQPQVDFTGIDIPLSPILLTHFPRASGPDALALDIGCGDVVHRSACEHAGFQYVGIDYQTAKAPMLADGHALPFKDQSFEFIVSIAVLEHIRYPHIMMKEAYRVLKPGGLFIGIVAFSEPFHQDSYYHHTHLGTYNSVQEAGFQVLQVSPSTSWRVLQAHAVMGLFPKMPKRLAFAVVAPLDLLHRMWWKLGGMVDKEATEDMRIMKSTGCFEFIGRRENASAGAAY
jgi:SAM-dependent methyltransferase